jgi:glycosyltransferase involved in cell wall biosynthesis
VSRERRNDSDTRSRGVRLGGGSLSTLVSIGIPFRDAQSSLGDAVRSVFAQTHQDWELLLIDDGSTDGSLELVRSIVDPRVRLRSDGTRRGLANRLNEIAHAARGTYLARMDADDLMHPERIQRELEFLEAHPQVDVVGTALISLGPNDEPVGSRAGSLPEPYTLGSILSGAQLAHPTVMARTWWFRSHPYDVRYERAEDMRLWCETVTSSRFAVLSDALHFYREGVTFVLSNYVASHRTTDRLLSEYGAAELGNLRTLGLRARNLLEIGFASVLRTPGHWAWLARRRNQRLPDALAAQARGRIAEIRKVAIPGLD